MDLNADVGEGYDDASIFPLLTSINVACGGHTGDDATMAATIALALRVTGYVPVAIGDYATSVRGSSGCLALAIGAHPSWPDREHFGRIELSLPADEVRRTVEAQIRALESVATRFQVRLRHVKPHGALYNQAARDPVLARAIAEAVRNVDPTLVLVGLAGSMMLEAARDAGLKAAGEAFADRRYRADGSLAPRSTAGAVIVDPLEAATQAEAIATDMPVRTIDGPSIQIEAATLCVHSDSPGVVEIARAVRYRLEAVGIPLEPLDAGR